jgi:hypothetical protein
LKNSQLLRRRKKFKPSRMTNYASALHFFIGLEIDDPGYGFSSPPCEDETQITFTGQE